MLRRCSTSRRCLWVAVPLVAGHLGCLAIPAATMAFGAAPILMPICSQGPGALKNLEHVVSRLAGRHDP